MISTTTNKTNKISLSPTERKRLSRERQRASMNETELPNHKKQNVNKELLRHKRKLHSMTTEQLKHHNNKTAIKKQSRRKATKSKKDVTGKGLIDKEEDWLITDQFVIDETRCNISDAKDRDEKSLHYLGKMDVQCRYCGGLGF